MRIYAHSSKEIFYLVRSFLEPFGIAAIEAATPDCVLL
jgi:hypothetical protein